MRYRRSFRRGGRRYGVSRRSRSRMGRRRGFARRRSSGSRRLLRIGYRM